eukprot:403364318
MIPEIKIQSRKFKTKFGALMTSIICLTTLAYLIVKLNIIFNRKDNKTSRYVMSEALQDDPSIINIQQEHILIFIIQSDLGIDIAFGTYFDIDPRYGKIIATHESFQYKDLELVKCKDQYFNYRGKNDSTYQSIYNFLCIKDKSQLQIGGAWTTNRLEEIDVQLIPCSNATTSKVVCATPKQQEAYFNNVDFQFRFVNQFFDFNDFQSPVKQYIEDKFFIPIDTTRQKSMTILVKKSKTKQYDSYIPFVPQVNQQFASIDNYYSYIANKDFGSDDLECFTKISMRMDLEYDIYTRQVYTFADLLSDLGGIYSSLFAFGAVIVGIFSENLFYYQIIKDLYQTRPIKENQSSKSKSKVVNRQINQTTQRNLDISSTEAYIGQLSS